MKRSWTALAVALGTIFALAGCSSNSTPFQPNTGAVVTFLAPSNMLAPGTDFVLTVNGFAFLTTTVVQWNGQTIPSKYVTANVMTAEVSASLTHTPGQAYVNTLSPFSGSQNNGLSNTVAFPIYGPPNPVPTTTQITPSSDTACGNSCTSKSVNITIDGSNFLPVSNNGGAQVTWLDNQSSQSTTLTITSLTPTKIKANGSGLLLSSAGTATVKVVNPKNGVCLTNCPDLGGGPSNGQTFTINAAAKAAMATAQSAVEETPAVSHDARFVAYAALQDEHAQIFVRDTCVGAAANCQPRTELASAAADGTAGNADSHSPAMSSDGRYIAFSSAATNLLVAVAVGRQVYLRDTCFGADAGCQPTVQLISKDANGALVGAESILPSVSASGRFVAFLAIMPSHAANPAEVQSKSTANKVNSGYRQVFVRDTCLGAVNCTPKTTRISLQPGDAPSSEGPPAGPALSGGAKHLALADGMSSTLFTHGVPVDDRVFLAISSDQR